MICIYGGTFDPIHFGHLRTAFEVAETLEAEVRLLPAYRPPHRAQPVASPSQRLAMLERALPGQNRLRVDTRELDRGGVSYMVDTLASLREEAGQTPLALVLGLDAFAHLDRWHQWERLIERAHLVVMTRPGGALPVSGPVADLLSAHRVDDAEALRARPAGGIWPCPVTALDISATRIRALCAAGRSPRWLLPDAVLDYIEAEGLYRN